MSALIICWVCRAILSGRVDFGAFPQIFLYNAGKL